MPSAGDVADDRPAGPTAASSRRAEILAIAAEVFAERGFANATVREIADAAGILSGSLYHHFDSKEAMVDEILSTFVAGLLADYRAVVEAGDDPLTTLAQLVRVQFRALVANRAAVTTARHDAYHLRRLPRLAYLADVDLEVARLWTDVIQQGIEAGQLRADLDPPLLWTVIRGGAWGTVELRRGRPQGSADELADSYLEVLLGGIRAGSAPA